MRSFGRYISCTSCHDGAGQDGRAWDFSETLSQQCRFHLKAAASVHTPSTFLAALPRVSKGCDRSSNIQHIWW